MGLSQSHKQLLMDAGLLVLLGVFLEQMKEPVLKWGKDVQDSVSEYTVDTFAGLTVIECTDEERKDEWIASDTAVEIEDKR